jgi:hypothetical protein
VKVEKLIAAIIFDDEDDLVVYCMSDSAMDIFVKGKMKDTTSV